LGPRRSLGGTVVNVALDATPLLGPRTGVGQYVDQLVRAMVRLPNAPELVLSPFTIRGGRRPADLPQAILWRHRPFPARGLQWMWQRVPFPSAEVLTGRTDVFHATNFVAPPTRRAHTVVTVHDLSFVTFPDTVTRQVARYRELVPRALDRAAIVLTPSHSVAAEVREHYGLPADRVEATPLGVDPSWAEATAMSQADLAALGLPARFLLFIGARQPRKDLPTLLAAHRDARSADPETPPLVLVGPPGWGEEADLTGSGVLVRDHLPRPVLQRLVASATAVVMPSLYEGFGLPVLEAMAAGTTVLASDIAAHREVGGDVPRFFTARAVDELAALILDVSRETPPAGIRARGRERAAAATWTACAQATVRAYQRAVM
jgi:glycosyltransferase involved in cell wall biosynthesis